MCANIVMIDCYVMRYVDYLRRCPYLKSITSANLNSNLCPNITFS